MRRHVLLAPALCALAALGCETPEVAVPFSLDAPRAIAVSRGEVCMTLRDLSADGQGIFEPVLRACSDVSEEEVQLTRDAGGDDAAVEATRRFFERGAIGLVVNGQSDSVAVIDMSRRDPRLIDLDLSTPGINPIPVGRRPIDIASSADGTVAYVLSERDQSISLIDVWVLRTLEATIDLDAPPVDLDAKEGAVVALLSGGSLAVHPGVRCEAPSNLGDRRVYLADSDCTGQEVAPTTASLPGAGSALSLDPRRPYAYVVYTDQPFMSVVALEDTGESCISGASAPCEVARIGLTTGCADGVDNDGDGVIDQDDPQCYGPFHAESADGIGRRAIGACADGEDNDGDGFADRDDPDCYASEQAAEDARPDFVTLPRPCEDGVDEDGDNLIDYPGDPDCYGQQGRTETPTPGHTFSGVDVDELGVFAYAIDLTTREVVVVDLDERALVDAPRVGAVPEAFQQTVGIQLGRSTVPGAVTGRVNRSVLTPDAVASQAEGTTLRYDLGAMIAGDNGFVYYVEAASVYCVVPTQVADLTPTDDLFAQPSLLDALDELECLTTPSIVPSPSPVRDCSDVFICQGCLNDDGTVESCAECQNLELPQEDALAECELGDRSVETGQVVRVFNPKMRVRDAARDAPASISVRAVCEQPAALLTSMNDYLDANPDVRAQLGCGSILMPQPLSQGVATRGSAAPDDFTDSRRFDLVEKRELTLGFADAEATSPSTTISIASDDYRLKSESWFVIYEGVLPNTRREDGLLVDGDTSLFDVGGLDVCGAGVRPGDYVVFDVEALLEAAPSSASCDAFRLPSPEDERYVSYRVEQVVAGELTLGLRGDGYIDTLPLPECFPGGITYEVRAGDQWLVLGQQSGAASPFVEVDGLCLPRDAAGTSSVDARANTGEVYKGPLLSFKIYEGLVPPVADLSFEVAVQRNFTSASLESNAQIQPQTVRPSQILYTRLPGGTFVFSPDPSDDVVYTVNLSTQDSPYLIR